MNQFQNLNNQIFDFLKGKLNYNVGLSLFMRVTTNTELLKALFGLETPEKKQLLKKYLTEYYESEQKQLDPSQQQSLSTPKGNHSSTRNTTEGSKDSISWTVDNIYIPVDSVPSNDSIIHHLKTEQKNLYRLRGIQHVELFNAISDENRHKIAIEIIKLSNEITVINAEIYKTKAGIVPERFIKKSRSAEEFVKIKNCEQYIRKFTLKLKSQITPEERVRTEILLEKHKNNLEKLING